MKFLNSIFKSPQMFEILLLKLFPLLKEGDIIAITKHKDHLVFNVNGEERKIFANGKVEIVKENNNQ